MTSPRINTIIFVCLLVIAISMPFLLFMYVFAAVVAPGVDVAALPGVMQRRYIDLGIGFIGGALTLAIASTYVVKRRKINSKKALIGTIIGTIVFALFSVGALVVYGFF